MKKRRIIMFFAMIMSIAVIGVGFAAWIITAPTEDGFKDGTIAVETVKTHGWKFELSWKDDDNSIVFGTPNTTKEGYVAPKYSWLSYNGTVEAGTSFGVEDLDATLTVKGVKADNADDFVITETAYVVFEFVGGKAVDYSKYFTYELSKTELTSSELTAGVDVTVTFKWKYEVNPYDYFNKQAYSEALSKEAYDYLSGLKNDTDGLSFKITLTTKNPNA
jgi:hypothetical protein